jgi:serine/threonine-protein kinase
MADELADLRAALRSRYTLEREIGRGGMATVWLADDVKHQRAVALKVLRPYLGSALTAERFLREIRVAARLAHPHILPLFDSGRADGFLYYVMPYVPGDTLRRRLERERQLPLADALRISADVADALDYAHRRGVVHRDIKPENILFEEGHAVVADFGVSRAIAAAAPEGEGGETLTEAGLAVGTLHYMSPEQVSGDRKIDGRADIYSLGCVLYEMLTGAPRLYGAAETYYLLDSGQRALYGRAFEIVIADFRLHRIAE